MKKEDIRKAEILKYTIKFAQNWFKQYFASD